MKAKGIKRVTVEGMNDLYNLFECEGTTGLLFDLSNEIVINTLTRDDNFLAKIIANDNIDELNELCDETLLVRTALTAAFVCRTDAIYTCSHCAHFSTTEECPCGNGISVTDIRYNL